MQGKVMIPKDPLHRRAKYAWMKYKAVYVMALLPVAYYIIFHYLPMPGILLAFRQFKPLDGWRSIFTGQWLGMENFQQLFKSYYFTRTIVNTIRISLLNIICGFPAPIIFAISLDMLRNMRLRKALQTVSYFPHFLSWVTVASLINMLCSPTIGLFNDVRRMFGLDGFGFLTNDTSYLTIIVLSNIWKSVGWSSIIYLAAIAGIDQSLYEAAAIDGAGRFKRVWHITIPCIMPTATVMLILNVGSILNAGFDQSFLLLTTPVMEVGDIIDTYVFREGISNMKYGFSTAVSLFKSLIGLVLVMGSNALARRYEMGLF